MKNARQIAVQALIKVDRGGGYSNLVLDHALERSGLEPRDKAFCCALFYGVLERRLALDAVIAHYSRMPLKRIAPQVLELARIALYQVLYMDGVPNAVAVNESVALAKEMKCGHAAGYLNGLLRAFLRDGGSIEPLLPNPETDPAGYLSLLHAVPDWLVKRWLADYGQQETGRILAAASGRQPLYLRANSLRVSAEDLAERLQGEGIGAAVCARAQHCVEVTGAGEIDRSPCYTEGLFTVQDLSSQLCALALDARPGMRVADVCAAPGGKAFTIAQLMQNQGELFAFDLHPQKVRLIVSGARRLGLSCVRASANDAKEWNPNLGLFDRVLCDVPCSGLGIIGRKPEIRFKTPEELAGLPEIQYKILENSAKYIKQGGRLLYSTCTLCRAENDAVADRFLAEHPEFSPAPLPQAVSPAGEARVTLLPGELPSDGFFMAAFIRTAEEGVS